MVKNEMKAGYERYYKKLELDKILLMLSAETTIKDASDLALQIQPSFDIDEVGRRLSETDEAFVLSAKFGAPSFGSVSGIKGSVKRALDGGVLNMSELLDIAQVLTSIRRLREYRDNCAGHESPILDSLFQTLSPNKYFEEKLFFCIKSEDEMNDKASAELDRIRGEIRTKSLNIRDKLDKMIKSSRSSKYLQDAIITQRDGRFVVPVKVEHRSEIPGLIHDTSSSGATLFVEPMVVVEINNRLKVLQSNERDEIERILTNLSAEVAEFAQPLISSYNVLIRLNLVFAKAALAYKLNASVPALNTESRVRLKNARHPLIDRNRVVPVSLKLGFDFDTLIITGPNTGGKTVSLKTVGLLTLMAMCGLMIPCDSGSEISVFKRVLADIGDEQSIEQSLSTFSSHMVNIVSILDRADKNTLVLVDELGAGTDPVEGAALATAVITKLRSKGACVVATTHYSELKSFAIETEGVTNASCEFNVDTLMPTYRLIIGTPGRSNAFEISSKLGLPDEVIDTAKTYIDENDMRFERIVAKLEADAVRAESEREQAALIRAELEKAKQKMVEENRKVEAERDKIIKTARQNAENIIDKVRRESNQLIEELERLKKQNSVDITARLQKARSAVKKSLEIIEDASDPVESFTNKDTQSVGPLAVGDNVVIVDIDKKAVVVEPEDKSGQVLVSAGNFKMRVSKSNLRLDKKQRNTADSGLKGRPTGIAKTSERTAVTEVDLRGLMADEAVLELDKYIDEALLSGINLVWIIHGKGTGALRKTVHTFLKQHKSVKSFRLGVYGEGENGVTIAELK
ncbi:MAG: endonuclease MutS2 [bacterium]|nr:endonuclease MutS2 [bacterium]